MQVLQRLEKCLLVSLLSAEPLRGFDRGHLSPDYLAYSLGLKHEARALRYFGVDSQALLPKPQTVNKEP